MKVDLGVWDWLGRLIVMLLVAAALVGLVVAYLPIIKKNEILRTQLYQTRQDILREQQNTNALHQQIKAFDRPDTIERLAREILGYARTNEVVYQFNEREDTPTAP